MKRNGFFSILIAVIIIILCFSGCTPEKQSKQFSSLVLTKSMQLDFATQFSVDYYDGGYKMISIADGSRFFVVPEGCSLPEGLDETAVPLYQPIKNIYLAATAAMCLFDSLERLDAISLSGTQADGWYIDNAKVAMQKGKILYAGKYSTPDYELIIKTQCPLAIESTMMGHASDVKDQLEQLGIAVLVDQSSNEAHPLGRAEWIRLYAALLNEEEKAEEIFSKQVEFLNNISASTPSGKTVAFFYINTSGRIIARKSGDYVCKMISLAGGKYIFDELGDSALKTTTVTLEPERFYAEARDADIIVYNSTISDDVNSLQQIIDKYELLKDFKAIKTGNVWCTSKNMYQESTAFGEMIQSLHRIMSDDVGNYSELPFFYRLK